MRQRVDLTLIAAPVHPDTAHSQPAPRPETPVLRYDATNVAYYVRPRPRTLVVGAGGGRDVLSALAFGAPAVEAVEINKDIIRTVNERFGDFPPLLKGNSLQS